MKGLMRHHFYLSLSNIKIFGVLLLLLGLLAILMDNKNPSLLILCIGTSIIGSSVNALLSLHKENAAKWSRYMLTFPLRRRDIIRSRYLSLLLGLLTGMLLAFFCLLFSVLLHGFPFDRGIDPLFLFILPLCISLLMSALFFPLSLIGGGERKEAMLILSLFFGIVINLCLISLLNRIFGTNQSLYRQLANCGILFAFSGLAFLLSYFCTARIFKQKEY